MSATLLVGWTGTLLVIAAYGFTARTGKVVPFHVANVIGAVLLGVSNIALGAWPALALNSAFGAIGLVGLLAKSSGPR